jgi:hypothetical protein
MSTKPPTVVEYLIDVLEEIRPGDPRLESARRLLAEKLAQPQIPPGETNVRPFRQKNDPRIQPPQ